MLTSIANGIYNNLPSIPKLKIDSPANVWRKVQQIALPAILLTSVAGVQGASAIGCLGCVICLAGGGGPFCIPICIVCGVTIPVPLG